MPLFAVATHFCYASRMKPGDGQLSLELFPAEVAAPETRPEPKARVPEPPRGQVPCAQEADDVTGIVSGSVLPTTRKTSEMLHVHQPNTRAQSLVAAAPQSHAAATALLDTPDALLTRTHLRELGLERRAVDAVFQALAVVALPGYSRPMIRVRDYLELIENYTFRDDRVRPSGRVA